MSFVARISIDLRFTFENDNGADFPLKHAGSASEWFAATPLSFNIQHIQSLTCVLVFEIDQTDLSLIWPVPVRKIFSWRGSNYPCLS